MSKLDYNKLRQEVLNTLSTKTHNANTFEGDFHLLTASVLLGKTYEQVKKLYEEGDEEVINVRLFAKNMNFALSCWYKLETYE